MSTDEIALNIPFTPMRVEEKNGAQYVYDVIRKKMVRLTPEEYVRQQYTHYMMLHLGYPQHAFANEVGVFKTQRSSRIDTLIFGNKGSFGLLIEFKAATVCLTEKNWQQLLSYHTHYQTPWLCLTNGRQQVVCYVDFHTQTLHYTETLPGYEEFIHSLQKLPHHT